VIGEGTLEQRLRRYTGAVAAEMRAVTATRPGLEAFYGMIHYHMGWVNQDFVPEEAGAGKGLRSAFCMLCCEVCGGDPAVALSIAAAIELLHNFSLIHDDIEDDSQTRRHRRTVWAIWGIPQGINLGDAVFALAETAFYRSPLAASDPPRLLEIMQAAQHTIVSLAEGQFLDISFETRLEVPVADYLAMIERKSALLIATAAWAGAIAAGASPAQCASLREFGRALGLAFQVRDDLLGIWGDEEVTGKSRASDILSRKKTLPVVLAFERAGHEDARLLRAIYGSPTEMDEPAMEGVLRILEATGAQALAEEHLALHRHAARDALAAAGLQPAASALLEEFSRMLIDRSA
jgi:geranylgeranyl diphosphate synthase type I